jgi:HSP20 family protein
MSIIRFDPFADLLTTLRQAQGGPEPSRGTNGRWVPAVDIFENGKQQLVLKAELPDMKREDIQVVFENNTLTLKGERKFEAALGDAAIKQEQFHRIERAYGTFSRSFSLPSTVDASKIAAEYKNGVLTITLPFREESKPRTINVEVAA